MANYYSFTLPVPFFPLPHIIIVTFSKPVDTHETTDWIYSLLDWYWYVHHAVHAPQPVSYTDYNRLSCSRIQLVYFVRLIPQNLRTKSGG